MPKSYTPLFSWSENLGGEAATSVVLDAFTQMSTSRAFGLSHCKTTYFGDVESYNYSFRTLNSGWYFMYFKVILW
jgi:hypothetical protein